MKRIAISLLMAITFSTIALSQPLDKIQLENRLSILNDRAFFNFPADAKSSARPVDIMEAGPNPSLETRVVFSINEMKLVFFAQELFKLGDKNLFSEVSAKPGDLSFKRKILSDKNNLLSILSTPTVFDSTRKAILIGSLLVKTPDNSIFRINAYINPEAFRMKDQFINLTERIFQTLSPGTRSNVMKAREETVDVLQSNVHFKFSIPENYCITVDSGSDFEVFRFHKFLPYSDTNWVSLIIYTGNYPSYFYNEYGFDKQNAVLKPGKFLDKEISWMLFRSEEKGIYLKEEQIPSGDIEGAILHVAMESDKENSLDELTKIVEKIKLIHQ